MEPHHSPAHSCKHCQRVILRRDHFTKPRCEIKLPHTGTEILEAVHDECPLIRLFFEDVHSPFEINFAIVGAISDKELQMAIPNLWEGKVVTDASFLSKWKSKRKARSLQGDFYIVIVGEGGKEEVGTVNIRYEHWEQSFAWELRAAPGVAAIEVPYPFEKIHSSDVGSDASLEQVRVWLEECHGYHQLCKQESTDFVPTRLLKIELEKGQVRARLVEGFQDQTVQWAALSYVWGGDQLFKTTASSLASMNEGFPIGSLPQTLQDAIADISDDLGRELAVMPQIYQHAWVTISASTAKHVSEGFLHDRGYSSVSRPPISLPYLSDSSKKTGKVILTDSRHLWSYKAGPEPIEERAWTYQERRLSPRFLDFTSEKLKFVCRKGIQCGGEHTTSWDLWGSDKQPNIPCVGNQKLPEWHDIVVEYMSRKLTFASDKLRALSALAELYKQSTKQTYIAGLWRETLTWDLCWMSTYETAFNPEGKDHLAPRPAEYRAPSWSWAAVDWGSNNGKIIFAGGYGPVGVVAEPLTLLDVTLEQDPPNTTYGQIRDCSLTLEGRVCQTTLVHKERFMQIKGHSVVAVLDCKEEGWAISEDANTSVLALSLTRGIETTWQIQKGLRFGLLLVEAAPQKYRRLGSFVCRVPKDGHDEEGCSRAFSMFETQTITMV